MCMDNAPIKKANKPTSKVWLKWAVLASVCALLLKQDQTSKKRPELQLKN